MIRTSKHILQYQTSKKNNLLDELFMVYRHDLELCIDDIIDNDCEIPKFGSFDNENGLIQSAVYKQVIFKQASEILRSQLKRKGLEHIRNCIENVLSRMNYPVAEAARFPTLKLLLQSHNV